MATITSPTYDPASTAAALAQKYVAGSQQMLTASTNQASATVKGLNDLSSALSAFQSSLNSLTGLNKSLFSQSASFSDTTVGTATASASAAPGSYSFVVEQLATASQFAYSGLADGANTGKLTIKLGTGPGFQVDLTAANTDGNATLTVRELAAAINGATGNTSLVSASVVTVDGNPQLVLSARNTGTDNKISLDTSLVSGPLKAALDNTANVKETVIAKDAIVWLGAQGSGTKIVQGSNTFSNIDGVKMTFNKTSATPVTLTVAADSSATTTNVQAFVDAYNKLKSAVDAMVSPGDPASGKAGGVFSGDSGIRALQSRLVSLLRSTADGSLANYGIIGARNGTLTLDNARLTKGLAADPNGLDAMIGSAGGTTATGIAGKLDAYIKEWNNSINGQIKTRKEAVSKLQIDLTARQDLLDKRYDSAYQRYLLQFTELQNVQSRMTSNSSMFDALFGNNKD